ncbi:hypothetical protein HHK36_025171 [Tetracentron sinense]|uniref:Transcription and mRNA export factor ENY2 n=1 Tax=Tetracentron sinense TaxID=13715 RepID=A0A834YKC8_TETSI|nr:hypothetical protein HHK36_025171 [Tetracentron sinense]
MQNFMWCIFKNSVAVKENLVARMIPNDRLCPICFKEGETINHLLFDCEFARAVWFATPYGIRTDEGGGSPMHERWESWLANTQSKEDQVLQITASTVLAWSLWKNKNSNLFQGSCKFPSLVARQAMGLVEEAFTNGVTAQGRRTPHIQHRFVRWIPPDGQWVKINCDGSANLSDGSMGIGAIARNSRGTILSGVTQGVKNRNAVITEATAIKSAVELAIRYGWNHILIESDALVLVHCLKHNQDPPNSDTMAIIADIKALAIKVPHLRFTYVPRRTNSFAHKLAAYGRFSGESNVLEAQVLNSLFAHKLAAYGRRASINRPPTPDAEVEQEQELTLQEIINIKLIESGEKERLKELLRERLIEFNAFSVVIKSLRLTPQAPGLPALVASLKPSPGQWRFSLGCCAGVKDSKSFWCLPQHLKNLSILVCTRAFTRKRGRNNVTVDDLVHEITPKGRASIPDSVKAELLQRIRSFLVSASL